jgi:hypothetical protein
MVDDLADSLKLYAPRREDAVAWVSSVPEGDCWQKKAELEVSVLYGEPSET